MMRIRGGRGLGDALYVRPFVEHLLGTGERVTVTTEFPEVYADTGAICERFNRQGRFDILAHYTKGKANPSTTQWQDTCHSAGIDLPLKINRKVRNESFVQELRGKADGRPLVLVHGGRRPMGRTDGFGLELMPKKIGFDIVLDEFRDCYTVRIGKDDSLYPLAVSLDLVGRTSVSDLLDIGQSCDGFVAQCSYAVPLAEAWDTPAMFVWAAAGMDRRLHAYIRQVTPKKILSKPTSSFVFDNWTESQIREEVRAFRLIR